VVQVPGDCMGRTGEARTYMTSGAIRATASSTLPQSVSELIANPKMRIVATMQGGVPPDEATTHMRRQFSDPSTGTADSSSSSKSPPPEPQPPQSAPPSPPPSSKSPCPKPKPRPSDGRNAPVRVALQCKLPRLPLSPALPVHLATARAVVC
jgi:hypothetical protein